MLRPLSILVLLAFLFSSTISPALAAINYTYDQNGNMSSDGTKCYEYNEANQLSKVKNCDGNQTVAEYIYDYNGKRLVKKEFENGSLKQTVFSPTDEYETKKIEGGATQNTAYYKVNGEIAARKNTDGSKTYYHNDHLGSNTLLTDQNGNVVEKTTYEPYGEVKSGGLKSKFGYTGQEKDQETGLNYYDARYYDPHLQRFTQPDTLLPDIYDPQQLNRYSYARNNPLKYTDPTGHFGFLMPYIATITSLITRIVQPVINLIAKVQSNPITQKIEQNAVKIQSNPAVQKTENNAGKILNKPAAQQTISNIGNITKSGSSTININAKGLNHVLERHIANGINSNGKSIFSNPDEIPTLIKNAEEVQPILQANGNLSRIVDANKKIGIDILTGKATSMYTVITDKVGNLITSHPGIPR